MIKNRPFSQAKIRFDKKVRIDKILGNYRNATLFILQFG